MRLSKKYGGIQFFAAPDIPLMYVNIDNYADSYWGEFLINVNGTDVPTTDLEETAITIYPEKLPVTVKIPLSHPTTYLDDVAYPMGTSKTLNYDFTSDKVIEISVSGPEAMQSSVSWLTIIIGGVQV